MPDEKIHICDTGLFSREVCPEPCGMMHSFCTECGTRADECIHEVEEPHDITMLYKDPDDETRVYKCSCGEEIVVAPGERRECPESPNF